MKFRYQLLFVCLAAFSAASTLNSLSAQEPSTSGGKKAKNAAGKENTVASKASSKNDGWHILLPKEGLKGWTVTDFLEPGKIERKGNTLVLGIGAPMTGITYKGKDIPSEGYEIEVQANRLEGSDFLCGLTFPIKNGFCSFIAGGWGGSIVGLSSVDGSDASENATTTNGEFKNNTWYTFRIVIDDEYVRGFIDDEEYFRQDLEGHDFETRIELDDCHPLGYAVYDSKVAIRGFRWRKLPVKNSGSKKTAAQKESNEKKDSK